VRCIAVAHVDPAKVEWVRELQRRYPPDPCAPRGVSHILRSGEPEMIENIPTELLDAVAVDDEHRRLIWDLELRSYIGVPLKRSGVTLGVITLVMAESRRMYDAEDLEFAIALAERASIAVEHPRLFRAAEAARAEAEHANRTKDDFLAMLGHELRNPLAPIVTALELMKYRGQGNIEREREIIERQVRSLVLLVDDLLDVSRITHGRIELKREPVELADLVSKGLEVASLLLENRRHHVRVEVPRGLVVDADPTRIAQVVSNLLTNAAKYTEPGGHIDVFAERLGDDIVLRVRDTGIGIEPRMLSRIFEVFVQETQALDRDQGGLGLGLAIVQNLVRLHGGTVAAASEGPGSGSEFVVTLPAATRPPRTATAGHDTVAAPKVASDSISVLVVDDNTDALEMMVEALTMLGVHPHPAKDGLAALEVALTHRPSIALLDLGLPVLDGFELAERLRGLPGLAGIKLVAVSGYGQASDRERTAAAGFEAHLVKPVPIDDVRRPLEDLVRRPRSG